MRITLKDVAEKIIWLLAIFLFTAFQIFEGETWGRYAFFGSSILIVILSAIVYDGKIRLRIQPFHVFFTIFIAFNAASSVWALYNPADATTKAKTLFQIFGCAAMLYIHYDRKQKVDDLISAVKWSGFIVTLYAIAFYGLDNMLESSQNIRLENEFNNVNTIAMAAALSCMLLWYDFMNRKNLWAAVLLVPAVILITATQSRKAFVLLLAGIFGVYIIQTARQKGFARKLLRVIFYAIIVYVGLQMLFRLPIFAGSLARMDQMLNFFTNEGKVDHSTQMRNDMTALGLEWWKKYPLLGIGMGNPHVLAANYLDFDAYLHNNFVELLCGGGVVGFVCYYSMHVYLIFNLIKYRKVDPKNVGIALVWLVLILIMNYGMVTYYSKTQWYYLAIHFVNVSNLRAKYKEMTRNGQLTEKSA